jgi:hypothetical protein
VDTESASSSSQPVLDLSGHLLDFGLNLENRIKTSQVMISNSGRRPLLCYANTYVTRWLTLNKRIDTFQPHKQ